MRVIVCGSRRWRDREKIADRLFDLGLVTDNLGCTLVSGGAGGADNICEQEGQKLGLLVEVHKPDYDAYPGKQAPLRRNEKMAGLGADLCLAFWDGRSTGTAHMMAQAGKAGIPVEVIEQ